MYDLLINAEVIVNDVTAAEHVLVDSLGFPAQRPQWSNAAPGLGFTFLFARVHPSLKVSPTRVEAMGLSSIDDEADSTLTLPFLPALFSAQGKRPWKTHANELATSDIGAVADRLRRNGCRFFTMSPTETVPFTRLWLGWTSDDPGAYQPDVDGGLLIEICETGALMQGPTLWDPIAPLDLPPGSMVRVLRRSWLVENLDETLRVLDRNLDWRPVAGPSTEISHGCRQAIFGFSHPRSADFEVLAPIGPGEIQDSLSSSGPGAWVIRIGVNDLDAKAEDLQQRGTPFDRRDAIGGERVLRVDTGPLGVPGLFEFAAVDAEAESSQTTRGAGR